MNSGLKVKKLKVARRGMDEVYSNVEDVEVVFSELCLDDSRKRAEEVVVDRLLQQFSGLNDSEIKDGVSASSFLAYSFERELGFIDAVVHTEGVQWNPDLAINQTIRQLCADYSNQSEYGYYNAVLSVDWAHFNAGNRYAAKGKENKSEKVQVRVTPSEYSKLKKCAEDKSVNVSEFVAGLIHSSIHDSSMIQINNKQLYSQVIDILTSGYDDSEKFKDICKLAKKFKIKPSDIEGELGVSVFYGDGLGRLFCTETELLDDIDEISKEVGVPFGVINDEVIFGGGLSVDNFNGGFYCSDGVTCFSRELLTQRLLQEQQQNQADEDE